MIRRILIIAAIFAGLGCERDAVDLANRACSDGECAAGYICNPLTGACTAPVVVDCSSDTAICPDQVLDNDPCSDIGSFIPCSNDATTCDDGCRICGTDGTWSACTCVGGDSCGCEPTNGGVERCDNADNDCNDIIDDALADAEECVQSWVDADGDGYGAGAPVCYCTPPAGNVDNDDDTDDANPDIHPGSTEVCDGIDNDGDGGSLALETDNDGDGYVECATWVGANTAIQGGDCNDGDVNVHPGATELCDGIDNDCSGGGTPADETDSDGDGDGYRACNGDCDPDESDVYPGAPEFFDHDDNDCDTLVDECIIDCNCESTLVSCYPLDTTPIDDLGPANIDGGSVPSENFVDGMIGEAYDFGGMLTVGTDYSVKHDLPHFTLQMWIYADSPPTSEDIMTLIDVHDEYSMYYTRSDRSIRCSGRVRNGDSVSSEYVYVDELISTGTWVHLACTYDGATFRLYKDGTQVGSANAAGTIDNTSDDPMRIGSNSPDSRDSHDAQRFDGRIDHVQMFSEARSALNICLSAQRTDCQ